MSDRRKKVVVGLSGGVDSAVSAALAKQEGYDVTGAFIRIAIPGYPCTAGEDRISAMRVAAHLQIPFVEVDLSAEYQKRVFDISIQEFEQGRTPNPDAICNREIKFGLFYEWARGMGADLVATGHYAQIKNGELHKAIDSEKDQSYFLWAVPQTVLEYVLFPIGHLTKPQVRALAQTLGLPNAQRRDSQGLCFLGPISVGDMLKKELHPLPGNVLNEQGTILGTHEGAMLYTMGQRHGFTLTHQSANMPPHFVIGKDLENNTITVSPNKFPAEASGTTLQLTDTNWIGEAQNGPCLARYRYRQELIPAVLDVENNTVVLQAPHYAPEGQSLVVYKQSRCQGGGVIEEVSVYPVR